MKTIYLILFLSSVLFSCNRKQEQTHIANNKNDSAISDSIKIIKDSISTIPKTKKDNVTYTSSFFEDPKNEKQLKAWRRKVLVDGDSYYYDQLDNYYYKNPDSKGEMIELTQAMINKHETNDYYKLQYYYNAKKNKTFNKDKYMKKAIKYLDQLAQKKNDDICTAVARKYLSEIYREGIYVKEDTIIANYLYNGGCNLDSILQARKVKNK